MASPVVEGQPVDSIPHGDKLEDTDAVLYSTSPARTWIFTWAFLTWVLTIGFTLFVMISYSQDITDFEGGPKYKRSDRVPGVMGVWNLVKWAQWKKVEATYTTEIPAAAMVQFITGNHVAASTILLDTVMAIMTCRIGDAVVSQNFAFTSELCQCMHQQHMGVYLGASSTVDTPAKALQLGMEYSGRETGSFNIPKVPRLIEFFCFNGGYA